MRDMVILRAVASNYSRPTVEKKKLEKKLVFYIFGQIFPIRLKNHRAMRLLHKRIYKFLIYPNEIQKKMECINLKMKQQSRWN